GCGVSLRGSESGCGGILVVECDQRDVVRRGLTAVEALGLASRKRPYTRDFRSQRKVRGGVVVVERSGIGGVSVGDGDVVHEVFSYRSGAVFGDGVLTGVPLDEHMLGSAERGVRQVG